jgi:glycosyltransferase involved in cell wall biosynthesis
MPRVSIILTVYKRTGYLAAALASVLAQSYRDFEIIVADDSGTRAAEPLVAACGDPERVHYLPHPATLGIAASLVRAVAHARGDFIAIINDDDVWERDLLAALVVPLEADARLVLAAADHWIMSENGEIDADLSNSWSVDFGRASRPEGIVDDAVEFAVLQGGPAINIASVFRKDAVDWSLVVPAVSGAYDYWISCLLAATRRPFFFVPRRLGRWRVHGGMETSRRSHDKGENLVYIYSTMLERGWFPELESALKARLAEALIVAGRAKLQFDRAREARRYLWRSFLLQRRPGVLVRAAASFLPGAIRARLVACLRVLQKIRGAPVAAGGPTRLGHPSSRR